ncbi:hypothetical protein TSMEX_001748 [Taenia solium]|eukprot:TsM_000800100 transcript=TsM_000800100 gene=TsM_000800100
MTFGFTFCACVRGKKTLKVSPPVLSYRAKKSAANHTREQQTDSKENSVPSPAIKQEDIDDAQRDLTSQIHNLVDIEFSSTAKKTETLKRQTTGTIDRVQKEHTTKDPPKEGDSSSHSHRESQR